MAGNKHDVEKAKAVIDAITSVYHHEITHPGVVRRPFDAQRSLQQGSVQCAAHSLAQSRGWLRTAAARARARRTASFATANLPLYSVICCVALLPRRVCAAEGATMRWSVVLAGNSQSDHSVHRWGWALPLLIRRAVRCGKPNGRSYPMVASVRLL